MTGLVWSLCSQLLALTHCSTFSGHTSNCQITQLTLAVTHLHIRAAVFTETRAYPKVSLQIAGKF